MKIVTRGQKMHIKNLGHIKDSAVTPEDYFGPRDYGLKDNPNLPDGGYTGEYENEALPNNVSLKLLILTTISDQQKNLLMVDTKHGLIQK